MTSPAQPTITIGISAFNEAATLPWLLRDIAKQQLPNCHLQQVLVISDGSSDDTVKVAQAATNLPIQVVAHADRQGLAARLNEICHTTQSDVLVLLNADIRLSWPDCLAAITQPILNGTADLTAGQQLPLPGSNWIERALARSMLLKNAIFMELRAGQNIFNCHGTIRAFSPRLYSQLEFKHSVGEDAYSYLFARAKGYTFQFVPTAIVKFREPNTWADYLKQVKRYQQSQTQFSQEFGLERIQPEYHVPAWLSLKHLLITAITHPLEFLGYGILKSASLFMPAQPSSTTWEVATSSKRTA